MKTCPNRRRRTRTVKVRTALSRHCPPGQTDNGQLSSKIRTESGQRTGSSQNKIRTDRHRTAFFYKIPDGIRTADRIQTPDRSDRKIRTTQSAVPYLVVIEVYRDGSNYTCIETLSYLTPYNFSEIMFSTEQCSKHFSSKN